MLPSSAVRPRARRSGRRARARQPDRRAHRLQRRLRAADRHPAADARRAARRARTASVRAWSAQRSPSERRPSSFVLGAEDAHAAAGSTTSRRHRGAARARHAVGGFDARIESTCRSAAGCRRARRWRSRCCARCARLFALAARRRRHRAHRAARRERIRRRAGRHHGPDGGEPGRRDARAVPRHAHARSTSACRCRPACALIVIDSGVTPRARRRRVPRCAARECEEAARLLGVDAARRRADRPGRRSGCRRRSTAARATSSPRTRACCERVEALRGWRLRRARRVDARESHASMRDDFEVSMPEIDLLVAARRRRTRRLRRAADRRRLRRLDRRARGAAGARCRGEIAVAYTTQTREVATAPRAR